MARRVGDRAVDRAPGRLDERAELLARVGTELQLGEAVIGRVDGRGLQAVDALGERLQRAVVEDARVG